jgi:hypothetical protein
MSEPRTPAAALLSALEETTVEDIARLDQEINQLRGRLAALEQVKKVIVCKVQGAPERKKPGPAAGVSDARKSKMRDERRRAVVEYLAQRGPRTQSDIMREFQIPAGSITGILDSPWFQKTDQGVHITPLARREVLES